MGVPSLSPQILGAPTPHLHPAAPFLPVFTCKRGISPACFTPKIPIACSGWGLKTLNHCFYQLLYPAFNTSHSQQRLEHFSPPHWAPALHEPQNIPPSPSTNPYKILHFIPSLSFQKYTFYTISELSLK